MYVSVVYVCMTLVLCIDKSISYILTRPTCVVWSPHLKGENMSITLKDVGSGFKRTAINENFDTIESELNSNVLRKDGSQQLEADIDMNSNKTINLANGVLNSDGVNKGQLVAAVASLGSGALVRARETQLGSAATGQVFTLAGAYIVGNESLEVRRNGLPQQASSYIETSTTSVTMVDSFSFTDTFEFIVYTAT